MPPKKSKPLKKTAKSIDKIYRDLKKEISKEKKERFVGKYKADKKNITQIQSQDRLEKDRRVFIRQIFTILSQEIDEFQMKEEIEDSLGRYYQDSGGDTDMKLLIQTFVQDIAIFSKSVKEYIKELKDNNRVNTLYYLKNKFVDLAPSAMEEKYVENLEQEIEGLGKDMTRANREEFLKMLGSVNPDVQGAPVASQIIKEYKTRDEFMANLAAKFDSRELFSAIRKYFEYKLTEKDIDPAEFINNQYNILKGIDEEIDVENTNLFKKLVNRLEKDEGGGEEDDEEGEMPEVVFVKSNKPVREIAVIITPELREKLDLLYRFVKPERKSQKEYVKSAVILGIDKKCLEFQTYKPWIYRFSSTWISAPAEILEKYSYPVSVIPPVVIDEIEYRHANRLFNILQCNSYSKNKTQNKDILTLYEDRKVPVEFRVCHLLTSNKMIKQDEDLFLQEKEYLEKRMVLSQSEQILNARIIDNFKIIEMAKLMTTNKLKRDIARISEKHKLETDPTKLEKYVERMVEAIYSKNKGKTIRDFLNDIADILLYLDNRMLGEYSDIFQKKLVNMFYKPETVVELKLDSRFEEFYKNPRYSKELKNKVSQRIQYYKGIVVEEISRRVVYDLMGRPTRQREYEKLVDRLDLDLEEIKSQCKNKDIGGPESGEYLVYTERSTGDTYCISLYNIGDRNPYTEKPYPKSVIKELEILDRNMVRSYFDKMLFGAEDEPMLAAGLMKLLVGDIKKMENSLVQRNIPQEKICGYCKKHMGGDSLLKTVVKHDSESQIVDFCKIKCFEEWEVKNTRKKK